MEVLVFNDFLEVFNAAMDANVFELPFQVMNKILHFAILDNPIQKK
jgi:hypothetical protein